MQIKDFSCPVCNHAKCSYIRRYEANSNDLKQRMIVKCLLCKTICMHPRKLSKSPQQLYEKQYWTDEILRKRYGSLRAQALARCKFIDSALKIREKLKILDVGAGIGYMNWGFKEYWNDISVEYSAVEVNPAALHYLEKDPGVNEIFNELDSVTGKFDVIILSHILEHITEPVYFLTKLLSMLRSPQGLIFVEVPCMDFRFKKRNEPHVVFYSLDSISYLLNMLGMEIVRIDTCGHPVWKKRADGGLLAPSPWLTIRQIIYRFFVPHNKEYDEYGGDKQWIRALCKVK